MQIKRADNLNRILFIYTVFGVAIAYMESAIVVYLRALYYPHGFSFPMKQIPMNMALIEIGREAMTIIIIWMISLIPFRAFKKQIALFMYIFGIWDIFYYFWLKVFINWPVHILNWDILFLIPVPWIGPCLSPVLVSAGLILAALFILKYPGCFGKRLLNTWEWTVEIICAGIILATYVYQAGSVLKGEVPVYYPWWLFLMGFIGGLLIFFRHFIKAK